MKANIARQQVIILTLTT